MINKNETTNISNSSKDSEWWIKLFDLAISSPGVKVDRESFLRKELKGKVPDSIIERSIAVGTIQAGVPKELAEKLAQNVINSKCVLTSIISFASGIPGGALGLFGGSAVDITQYFGNFFNLSQKLMYIYGYKDISEFDSSQIDIMIAMLGAASGIEMAQIFVAKQLPKLVEKITAGIIAKQTSKNIFKKIANKILVVLGKKGIAMFTKDELAKI